MTMHRPTNRWLFCSIAALVGVLSLSCQSHAPHAGKPHWSYEGATGPDHWGELAPSCILCKTGKAQSPIDIANTTPATLVPIEVNYKPVPLSIVNNGHTIQVDYAPGSSMKIGGEEYQLLQFHFHTPSEHTVKGNAFAMEGHLVHKSATGVLAVIGVLMDRGAASAFIGKLWEHLPIKKGERNTPAGVTVNAAGLLPKSMGRYSYMGSLTTPPCSEGVVWNVLKSPIAVSDEQVAAFAAIFKHNARPVQPLNGRVVKESQ